MKLRCCLLLTGLLAFGGRVVAQSKHVEVIKEESSITYHLKHPLHKIESTSKDVVYKLEADVVTKEIKSVSAQVDVTTFDSGNSNRDSHAMEVVDAITYPDVTFSSTAIRQNGDSLSVTGMLTFHGVTKEIIVSASSAWSSDTLRVQGGFGMSLTEFQIERPSLLMIPVSDTLWFTLSTAFVWK